MRRRHHTFQFSLFILSVTLSIAKGLADCVVVLCLHCLASRKMLHFVLYDKIDYSLDIIKEVIDNLDCIKI